MLRHFALALLILSACATTADKPTPQSRPFEIEARRGVQSEKTLATFQYALAEGADTLEMELHPTRGHVLVIAHDLTFEAMLEWLTHEPNPRAKKLFLNVETKGEAAAIIAMTKKYGVFDRLILQSFDYRTLRAAREIDPATVLSVLIAERPASTLAEIANDLRAQIVSPNYAWLGGVDVESLHVLGMRVVPWTVNSEKDWRRMANLGVDGIITDDPKGLFEFRHHYFNP